jgi:diaminohydroxyphosphoribosylaminopyrimidine deaminase / 5-amino-6-(5-phosphoribosylamino)uracil reductase
MTVESRPDAGGCRLVAIESFTTGTQSATDPIWNCVLAASVIADKLEQEGQPEAFGVNERGELLPVPIDHPEATIVWHPGSGWQSRLLPDDPRSALLDLYLPICGSTSAHPVTVGHLGQSLDGFIATHSGDSQFVTGHDNLVHLHRMRVLCGVVVVGAGTVAADDPQLTTRHVPGPNPLRVIFDPARRLLPAYRVFTDDAAPTLYVCGRSRIGPGETHMGRAAIVGIDDAGPGQDVAQVLTLLRARGYSRVFVEGGGVTVSAFLEANLLDRLQITIAPLLIGEGRPAIRLAPQVSLRDCRRPGYRVFLMGGDVLFDCELNAQPNAPGGAAVGTPPVTRVI